MLQEPIGCDGPLTTNQWREFNSHGISFQVMCPDLPCPVSFGSQSEDNPQNRVEYRCETVSADRLPQQAKILFLQRKKPRSFSFLMKLLDCVIRSAISSKKG